MDFLEVLDVFGGTIFPEELRGNFVTVDAHITELEEAASAVDVSVHQKAQALLLRGIYYLLLGDFSNARRHIRSIFDLTSEGLENRWLLRTKMYDFYILVLQYRPPAIRFRSSNPDTWTMLNDARCDFEERRLQAWQVSREILQLQPPNFADCLEQGTILDALSFNTALHISMLAHPKYTPLVTTESLLPTGLGDIRPKDFQLVLASGIPAGFFASQCKISPQNSLERFAIEVDLARVTENTLERLQKLYFVYIESNDLIGAGLCKILEGDHIISPPFTNPIALNLIVQVRENGWENKDWDSKQLNFRLRNNPRAQECYSEALHYMEAAGSPRGQGAVFLRRGCIYHAEALDFMSKKESAQANENFQLAESNFAKALALFVNDTTNSELVHCHQILLATTSKTPTNVVDMAQKMGRRMRATDNFALSQFLGLLLLRFGHFQFTYHRNLEAATACCEYASVYFGELDEPIASLSTAIAHIMMLKESQNTWKAQAKVRQIIRPHGILDTAMAFLDSVISQAPKLEHFNITIGGILQNCETILTAVCTTSGNDELRNQVEKVLHPLRGDFRAVLVSQKEKIFKAEAKDAMSDHEIGFTDAEMHRAIRIKEIRTSFNAYYDQCVSRCSEAIGQRNMERAEAELQTFITHCGSVQQLNDREILCRKIPALAQLGRINDMHRELPIFVSNFFKGEGDENLRTKLKHMGMPGDALEFAIIVRGNLAEEDISMCFVAQAWETGAEILKNIRKTLPEFLEKKDLALRPHGWRLMTYIAAFYEHEGKLEEALDWYLEALSVFENLREKISDPDARRAAYGTVHTGELYCGLTRTSLALSSMLGESDRRDPEHWGLPASSWKDQALIFMEQGKARSLLDILLVKEAAETEQLQDWMKEAYSNRLLSTLFQPRQPHEKRMTQAEVAKELNIREDMFDPVEESLKDRQGVTLSLFRGTLFLPDTRTLYKSIPPESLVLEMAICMSDLLVLCISSSGVHSIHKSNVECMDCANSF
ncbi:hypothetical protein MAA_11705 [Metarhizium robertsii ARSEF 23]|uniref:Uncharacterized protein n=1 Tax=Metarhizium robertsii (strain ARSEF 23 / ATCC MYA-3075) TaxID=655844 RepID=A0A0B2XFK4_METRA|nr:uncharacterized protein MAA_11705 [Metarhizium robertsii ARSEF 23]KHO10701.1 hypothetical protein MAA_11705 [Metarhizium robertsii ARSEF 23]